MWCNDEFTKVELTHDGTTVYSMEDEWLWYLSGVVDSNSLINVKIQKDSRLNLGHSITPFVQITRPNSAKTVFGMIDEYSLEVNSHVIIREKKNSIQGEITGVENIRNFINPLMGGMIQQRERAEYFLDKLLPHFEDGPPQSEEEFIEVVEDVEQLHEYPIVSGSSKYDADYFREVWSE